MKSFFRYLRAQCKRFALAYPKILALIIVTVLCIGAVAAAVFAADDEKSKSDALKVRVGIVGNLEDTYLDLAVFALQNMDSSKYYADMITMELDEAKKSLESGEIIGYLTVPDGYVEAVLNGEDELLTYVINDTPATFVPQLMNEVIETVSHYVLRSQSGIYGYTDFSRENDIPRSEYRPKADDMAFDYLDIILNREAAVETEYIGDIGGFDLKVYYICAFFCLILLLWGQSAAPLLIKQEMALPRLLSIRKTNAVSQVFGELIPFFVLQLFNTLLLFIVLWAAAQLGVAALPLPYGSTLGGVLLLFVKLPLHQTVVRLSRFFPFAFQ